ncbi:2-methylaconitate cis-trans isomerase PrpF [Psychrosphaera sp. 1_MG-2023]|uniref:2-methylaconitate cis-trans isomerase PrpF n=1 Tax=Psychrosphaera algicola TaxID=3023714 RepID=A0ABT5F9J0_9GAMM|nr:MULTISPECIES: 2-methylaconitate cis-trans isomerase PrpF [unclassified Psychrosphaera]MDC2888198.1 2-methylaconitate cis-trans isomerase PrpF [Psychrosphaera sp. G1-22]MDO6721103.1 2-methylaconitate cis-trans isomerase PrpF [Psychrosphaera sp. 1_MG-2023]
MQNEQRDMPLPTKQMKVLATYMRGGTSKGVFFNLNELPLQAQQPGAYRDALLLRVIGSPDPYGKHTDGMGGATSSTSKTVILSKSEQPDHDVDYLFGQVAIDKPFIDWSGNCGNLTAAVGAFAITNGLVDLSKLPKNGIAEIKIWQQNISKTIIAHVPMCEGEVLEIGDFELDGVTFPAAEVVIDFVEPVDPSEILFPTGNLIDTLNVPNIGEFQTTFINAGIPTLFLNAEELGFDGTELQDAINGDDAILAKLETIRAYGAVQMGLIKDVKEAEVRQHTPKIAFVSGPKSFVSSSGKTISADAIDLNVRAVSMGKLHHAMMGTAAVAIGAAAAIPGTIVNLASSSTTDTSVTFGHPSGTLKVGAEANLDNVTKKWQIAKVSMSRSARILMEGTVRIPPISNSSLL